MKRVIIYYRNGYVQFIETNGVDYISNEDITSAYTNYSKEISYIERF